MIVSDKRVLEASLASGMLAVQQDVIKLYTSNLGALGFIAATIGSLQWNGLEQTSMPVKNVTYPFLGYMFYGFDTVALCICFYIFSMCTISSIWLPVMAMNGEDASAVTEAIRLLKQMQYKLFFLINVMFVFMFLASATFHWGLAQDGPAAMASFVFVVGITALIVVGYRTVRIFDPDITIRTIMNPGETHEESKKPTESMTREANEQSEILRMKAEGVLFVMGTLSQGSVFKERYAVIENGKLTIFADKSKYLNHENALMKPFMLSHYHVVTKMKDILASSTAPSNMLTSSLSGNPHLTIADSLRKDYDLKAAAEKYRFNLVAKVQSELETMHVGEFMAPDEESFRLWTESLKKACSLGRDILAIGKGNSAIRGESMSVEVAVKAADVTAKTAL